ncbi:uncharacterized protein Nmag_3525 [Natrialba magadii ATCC 43099]|uniref:Blue (type 1) copper domain-containing protein n=1 Tax=Natrialba magadii (strain ATCC 43099 / DSM 3394 / CCM 3739 / CIP 104546 / IAM 13178 / JCM 8861 / NBRC 102185 / NCIMB 2190 / MS3) TaxID=547559 RepID=D3STY6_NATMM|nr:twin-arginine translocation signal domain-containing protein [Natrialba magadii]ADD07075.1 uncharacterized protein Nmag_3525 [Natrialba magadii ATCC 43099]ELY28782.1 hypothetical protein C500_12590 [Natrialba magadii ATCC 43099]
MTDRTHTRRTVLQAAGATSVVALAAGCLSDDEEENGGGNGGGNGGDDDIDPSEWEDVDTIELDGVTAGWEGVAPDMIAGETNPTIVLFEGQEYDFTWYNEDSGTHNIEIWDEDETVVEDYQTDEVNDDEQTLSGVVASEEMAYYRCAPHSQMQAPIQVESE